MYLLTFTKHHDSTHSHLKKFDWRVVLIFVETYRVYLWKKYWCSPEILKQASKPHIQAYSSTVQLFLPNLLPRARFFFSSKQELSWYRDVWIHVWNMIGRWEKNVFFVWILNIAQAGFGYSTPKENRRNHSRLNFKYRVTDKWLITRTV